MGNTDKNTDKNADEIIQETMKEIYDDLDKENVFEEKEQLEELLTDKLNEEGKPGIQVYIGNEMPVQSMKDCSVVTATYSFGGGMEGTIGIVGPKRMDYQKAVDALQTVMGQLDSMFRKEE